MVRAQYGTDGYHTVGRSRLPNGAFCCQPLHLSRSRSASGTYRIGQPWPRAVYLTRRCAMLAAVVMAADKGEGGERWGIAATMRKP